MYEQAAPVAAKPVTLLQGSSSSAAPEFSFASAVSVVPSHAKRSGHHGHHDPSKRTRAVSPFPAR